MIPRMQAALASVEIGTTVRIRAVSLEPEAAAWIEAVGLQAGEEVTVLRRAALGGPLHVRTSSGGEFAVAREVANAIVVEPTS